MNEKIISGDLIVLKKLGILMTLNRALRTRVFFFGLLLAGAILLGFSLGNRTKASATAAPVPAAEKVITPLPVEIIETGKPTHLIEVPVKGQSIPEISVLVLAPVGWLLLLKRQK